MRRPLRGLSVAAQLLLWSAAGHAWQTPPLDGEAARIDVTNATSFVYNANNRNSHHNSVTAELDDHWGLLHNRFNLRSSWKSWRVGLRVDGAWFPTSRSPTDVALTLLERRTQGRAVDATDGSFFVQKFYEAGQERSTRFTNFWYPAKWDLSYRHRWFDLTLGDFYAQFGRGLVLSLRKQDELSSDTTLRGARLDLHHRIGEVRLELTLLGGTMNPLRLDEASGRYLSVDRARLTGLARVSELGMPSSVSNDFVPEPHPTLLPDHVLGMAWQARTAAVAVGLHGARLVRGCTDAGEGCVTSSSDLVRSARTIDGMGISLEFPALFEWASLYTEYAHQALRRFATARRGSSRGNALYASLNLHRAPLTLVVEGKHYRNLQPLSANIDPTRAREFSPLQYNRPPTIEPVWNDTQFESFNTCTTGARARLDVAVSRTENLFAWVGRYHTWGETAPAGECRTDAQHANRIWDIAQGAEFSAQRGKSTAQALVGVRFDTSAHPVQSLDGQLSSAFYREAYVRYDVVRWLGAERSLQFQGWLRRRRQAVGGPSDRWFQATTVSSVQWGPALNLALGLEYDGNPAFPDTYVNGQVRYNLSGASSVAVFVGQRQGGLRCVSGICRVYPPFEGLRLDATLQF